MKAKIYEWSTWKPPEYKQKHELYLKPQTPNHSGDEANKLIR
jgi:hypothetical protein